jgi:hypothetical protein
MRDGMGGWSVTGPGLGRARSMTLVKAGVAERTTWVFVNDGVKEPHGGLQVRAAS